MMAYKALPELSSSRSQKKLRTPPTSEQPCLWLEAYNTAMQQYRAGSRDPASRCPSPAPFAHLHRTRHGYPNLLRRGPTLRCAHVEPALWSSRIFTSFYERDRRVRSILLAPPLQLSRCSYGFKAIWSSFVFICLSNQMGESSFQRQLACGEQPSAAKRRAMSLSLWRGDGSASQLEKNTEVRHRSSGVPPLF